MKGPLPHSALDSIHRAFLRQASTELDFFAQVIQTLCEEAILGLALKSEENFYCLEYSTLSLVASPLLASRSASLFDQHKTWMEGKFVEDLVEKVKTNDVQNQTHWAASNTTWWITFPVESPVADKVIFWLAVPDKVSRVKLPLNLLSQGVLGLEKSLRQREELHLLGQEVIRLQNENTQVTSLLNAFPDMLFVLDEKGTILKVRAGNTEDLVMSASAIPLHNIQDLPGLAPDTFAKFSEAVHRIQSGESHTLFEYHTIKDKEIHYFEANMASFGERQYIAIVRNITQVKHIESDLFKSSKLFEQAGKLAKIGAWEYDCLTHKHHWSQVTREILGYDPQAPEPSVEEGLRLYQEEESFQLISKAFNLAVQEGIPYDVELRVKTYTGEEIWVRALGIPVMREGVCQRIFGTFQDISSIKRGQEELSLKVKEFSALFENMGQGVVYNDHTGAIIRANDAAQEILGLSLETLLNSSSIDPRWHIITEEGMPVPGEQQPAMRALKSGQRVKDQVLGVYIPAEQRYRWILVDATPEFMHEEEKPFRVFSTFTDISELKDFETKLEEKRVHLLSIMESSVDGIWSIDREMKLTYANEVFKNDFYKLLGKTIHAGDMLLPKMSEEGQKFWSAQYTRGLQGERFNFEFHATFQNGDTHIYKVNCNPIQLKGEVIGLALFGADKTRERLYTQAIEQQNRQLRDISWSQSHLVREPLTKIMGICQLIKETGMDKVEELELIPALLLASEEMDQVIQRIIQEANASKK
ncbi:MAG: PAS domain-containing protein [Nitritalea sp.]